VVTPPDHDQIDDLAAARARVLERIRAACERAGRDPSAVTLVAVSKTVDAARLRAAVAAGFTLLGENRVQEGEAKAPAVPGASWQLVGPLQSNKARRALEVFDSIQTVDSVALAERLDRLAAEVRPGVRYPVLVQVNVDADPAKAGFAPDVVEAALPALLDLSNLEIRGLMTVGRLATDPADARATFTGLRVLGEGLRSRWPALGPELSMGMSDDFELAIEEGATIVRVGRAIFGERPHHHGPGEPEHAH
jgi:pyridoxal phosphate enzyme (YggS family)